MGDHFRQYLQGLQERLKELPRKEKRNIYLAIGVSIFIMGVFFYTPPREITLAKSSNLPKPVSLNELVPTKKLGTFVYKDKKERKEAVIKAEKSCFKDKFVKEEVASSKLGEKEVVTMVSGHPIEEMAPYISKRDKKVASFLVAIAKKESNWGTHSPVKYGRNCYNYWGYRGKENTTESGYSCFDNPEHAVQVVGDRIENLLNKKIDTPTKMVVWKCGRDCEATGGQAAANKWIADVAHIYTKLQS